MSEEDRKFLEEALKSMTVDVVEELNKAMRILIDGNASEDDQVQALEVVTNFVADIDTANGNWSYFLYYATKLMMIHRFRFLQDRWLLHHPSVS